MKEWFDAVIDGIRSFFDVVTSARPGALLSVIGLFLLLLSGWLAYRASTAKPEERSQWYSWAIFGTMICGVVFSAVGSALTVFLPDEISRTPIAKAFDNLESNQRVHWLIRTIVFDPEDHNTLSINRLSHLGPSKQQYTFVAPYEELVGYKVDEVVHMTGGVHRGEQRVSGIIFPLPSRIELYPANARGLLQVISKVENSPELKIDKPFLRGKNRLSEAQVQDMQETGTLESWAWKHYKHNYRTYCELVQEFRCDRSYSMRTSGDYIPIGIP
jgi:hypothetical protein